MSKLIGAIKEYMYDFKSHGDCRRAGEISARFKFPAGFIGFQGHFPGKPILPGVCKIQAVLCMVEKAAGKEPRLKEIVLAKFFNPVSCDEEILFQVVTGEEPGGETRVKVVVSAADKKAAELHLKIRFEGA